MKKLLFTICISILLIGTSQGQDLAYQKGDHLLNAGFGLGYYNYGLGLGRSFSLPAVEANLELGIHEYIGVGPYVGFVSWNYSTTGFDGDFSIFTLGARGSFHYSALLEELLDTDLGSDELDLYVAFILGAEFESYTGDFEGINSDQTRVFIGPVLGLRYYLSNSFGLYAEGGRGSFSLLKLGVTVKI